MHLVWCESVRCNLCHHEVFRHCEQSLGHGRSLVWVVGKNTAIYAPNGGIEYGKLCALSQKEYCPTSSAIRGERPLVHYTLFYVLACRVSRMTQPTTLDKIVEYRLF